MSSILVPNDTKKRSGYAEQQRSPSITSPGLPLHHALLYLPPFPVLKLLNRVETSVSPPLFSLSTAALESKIRDQDRENAHECSLKIVKCTNSPVHISQHTSPSIVSKKKFISLYYLFHFLAWSSSLRSSLIYEKNIFLINKKEDIYFIRIVSVITLWYIISHIFRKFFGFDRKLYESLLPNLCATSRLILIITNTIFLSNDYCSSLAFNSLKKLTSHFQKEMWYNRPPREFLFFLRVYSTVSSSSRSKFVAQTIPRSPNRAWPALTGLFE